MSTLLPLDIPEDGKLADNITHFARALRKAGLKVGPGRVIEAIRAVEAAGFSEKRDFYWVLHAIFVSRPEERATFAQVFRLYWRDPRYLEHMMSLMLPAVKGAPEDRRAVAALSEPPPPVEAIVRDVLKDQANRPKFIHITAGSDDGLQDGHVLDIYRTAERNNGRAKYLGKIRLTLVEPDEAVGVVVESARNGIIEVGDNATTKL